MPGSRLGDPNHVPFRVGELGEDDHAGNLRDRHDRLTALRLNLAQVGLRVVDLHVESDLVAAAVAAGDAAADSLPGVVNHTVVHRVAGVDFPAEHARIEVLEFFAVLAGDLEPSYGVGHVILLSETPHRGVSTRWIYCFASVLIWLTWSARWKLMIPIAH